MLGQKETLEEFKKKLPLLIYIIAFFFTVILFRLLYLQVYLGPTYRFFSQQNSLRKEKIPGGRGLVFDRNMNLMVDNRLQVNLSMLPGSSFKNDNDILHKISQFTQLPYDELIRNYKKQKKLQAKFSPLVIFKNLPWENISKIENHRSELPGIDISPNIRRLYLEERMGSHLFGYLSEVDKNDLAYFEKKKLPYELGDWVGRAGLERKWEKFLRGKDGYRYVVVDAHGRRLNEKETTNSLTDLIDQNQQPKPGNNLILTIDLDLQKAAADALEGKMGSIVAMDPRTGEVLAMHSMPGYDPTELTLKASELWLSYLKNPYGPLRNKAIQDHFPPGSTFKIFSALAALKNKVVTPQTTVFCPGFFRFGNRVYHCHKQSGHGQVNLQKAIRQSCDVYFYNLATKLSINQLAEEAQLFGLGQLTKVELDNEVRGLIPTEEWKKSAFGKEWVAGETLSSAIGQGYNLVTPLQLANAYATFVNGGKNYKPYIVSKVVSPNGDVLKRFGPELLHVHDIPADHMDIVKKGLFDVVNNPEGTGYWKVRSDKVAISGKSGTVQVISLSKDDLFKPCARLPFNKRHHAWFVGYAPAENPEIVVAALGMHECGGSIAAGPMVKTVIEKWYEKKMAEQKKIAFQ
jgi:penicillin-binding protein 2